MQMSCMLTFIWGKLPVNTLIFIGNKIQVWYFTDIVTLDLLQFSWKHSQHGHSNSGYKYECSIGTFYRYVMLSRSSTLSWFSVCCINVLLHRFSTDLLYIVVPCPLYFICNFVVHFGTNRRLLSTTYLSSFVFGFVFSLSSSACSDKRVI